MKVKVKNIEGLIGYYDNVRRRAGDVFEISDKKKDKKQKYPDAFSSNWMEPVGEDVEVKKASPKEDNVPAPVAPSRFSKTKIDAVSALKKDNSEEQVNTPDPSGDEDVI